MRPTRARPSPVARRIVAGVLAALAALAVTGSAMAAWSEQGKGDAASRNLVMPAGLAPAAVASTDGVAVRWPAVALANGVAVEGYVIRRFDASGAEGTVGPGCAGVVTATTCLDTGVPAGVWTYTDTPVLASWSGAESPPSAGVTVP